MRVDPAGDSLWLPGGERKGNAGGERLEDGAGIPREEKGTERGERAG